MRQFLRGAWHETRGRPFLRFVVVVYIALPFVLGGVAVYSLMQRGQITDLAHRIQASRIESARRVCLEQNERHDRTIAELDKLIRLAPSDRRAQAETSRAYTVRLIDALVPHRDCKTVVNQIRLK